MSSNLTGATALPGRIVQLEGDNSFKLCAVRVRIPVRLHKSRSSIPVWRLVCKTNLMWVQFPSCSRFVWKVSIIGNAAVLKTAVRVKPFAGSSPAPSAIIMESRQILVCCGILLRCFSHNNGMKVRFLCSPLSPAEALA